jgi:hypothetical protein
LTRTTVSNISFPKTDFGFFANSMRFHDVGAEFEGFITFEYAGDWQISLASSDGSRIFLWPKNTDDPRLLINSDFTDAKRRGSREIVKTSNKNVKVSSSQLIYAFFIEFFVSTMYGHSCTLSWKPPNDSTFKLVPSSAFTRPADNRIPLPNAPKAAIGISTGVDSDSEAHSCFIAMDRSLWCHGTDSYSQLLIPMPVSQGAGQATSEQNSMFPVSQPGQSKSLPTLEPFKTAISDATDVAAGGQHSCITDSTGFLKCWGGNSFGQIGDGYLNKSVSLPTVPLFPLLVPRVSRIRSFSLGKSHTCAIDDQSRMFCWGDGGSCRLGPNCSMCNTGNFNWLRLVISALLQVFVR